MKEIDECNYRYADSIVCPYCGCVFDDSSRYFHGDYFDGATTKVECQECERKFEVMVKISPTYSSFKTEGGYEADKK